MTLAEPRPQGCYKASDHPALWGCTLTPICAVLFLWRHPPLPREHNQFTKNTHHARQQTSTDTLTPVRGTFGAHSASSLSSSPPPLSAPPSSPLLLLPFLLFFFSFPFPTPFFLVPFYRWGS